MKKMNRPCGIMQPKTAGATLSPRHCPLGRAAFTSRRKRKIQPAID
jgi:hypothetical protein